MYYYFYYYSLSMNTEKSQKNMLYVGNKIVYNLITKNIYH